MTDEYTIQDDCLLAMAEGFAPDKEKLADLPAWRAVMLASIAEDLKLFTPQETDIFVKRVVREGLQKMPKTPLDETKVVRRTPGIVISESHSLREAVVNDEGAKDLDGMTPAQAGAYLGFDVNKLVERWDRVDGSRLYRQWKK